MVGERKGSQKRQRAQGVYVACTSEEAEAITEKAQAAGKSRAAYMRACALGDEGPRAKPGPTLNKEITRQAIAELNKAGSNLNQIARSVNMKQHPAAEAIAKASEAVELAALQILEAFGRKVR